MALPSWADWRRPERARFASIVINTVVAVTVGTAVDLGGKLYLRVELAERRFKARLPAPSNRERRQEALGQSVVWRPDRRLPGRVLRRVPKYLWKSC
jgi:hypothetical protein